MTPDLRRALSEAKEEVEKNKDHGLSFETRRTRVLINLGAVEMETPRFARVTIGLRRRTNLAIATTRRVLPYWESVFDKELPHHMLHLAERALTADREKAEAEATSFNNALYSEWAAKQPRAMFVARASIEAVLVAVGEERLVPNRYLSDEEIADPQDPDNYDCAHWASLAAASIDGNGFDPEAHREFWLWYLDIAVPGAYASVL